MPDQSLSARIRILIGGTTSAAVLAHARDELGVRDALTAARDHLEAALRDLEEADRLRESAALRAGAGESHDAA